MEKTILLILVTPDGSKAEAVCDSVRFSVPDGESSGYPGGSVGIRYGHAAALMSVAAGRVTGSLAGDSVLQRTVEAGIAIVSPDAVTILTDRIRE